jgi:O-antigen/teichoic acid export membrane protein
MATAAYMRFGSIGVKSAFQKYVAEATGNGDFEKTNKLLSTGCAILLSLSLAGLIPIAFFSRKLAIVAGIPSEFLRSSAHSITMLALIMVIANVGAVYEAIVMGGHRVDLARNFSTLFTVAEAAAIVVLLHAGFGLFAMSSVMAVSELGFILCCYLAAKKILPQIRLSVVNVTSSAVRELVRFAGSYQLANILEVLYLAVVPFTVLRILGANASGVYALTTRLSQSALMLPDALLLPILSGGAMVFASGSAEQMKRLIAKSFKVTLALGLFPLAFIAVFGPKVVFAWTGEVNSSLRVGLWLVCAAGLFQSFSTLGLVLYRVSGRALLDNIRQGLRIAILFSIALFARRLGFYGVLAGFALAELAGMLFMLFALVKTFEAFRIRPLLPEAARLCVATCAVLGTAGLTSLMPMPAFSTPRFGAAFQLAVISSACILTAWPALVLTKSVTGTESRALVGALLVRRHEPQPHTVETAG